MSEKSWQHTIDVPPEVLRSNGNWLRGQYPKTERVINIPAFVPAYRLAFPHTLKPQYVPFTFIEVPPPPEMVMTWDIILDQYRIFMMNDPIDTRFNGLYDLWWGVSKPSDPEQVVVYCMKRQR